MKNHFNEDQDQDAFKFNYELFKEDHRTLMIPVALLYDSKLTFPARTLFGVISGLSFKQGYCYATNDYLADKIGLKRTSIIKYIGELEKELLIVREPFKSNKMVRRKIFIQFEEMCRRYESEDLGKQSGSEDENVVS